MASGIFERDDLSIYVVAGAPRNFKTRLVKVVRDCFGESGEVKLVNGEMTEWLLAKLREADRKSYERTPASAALWRAYRALSAARYHLHDEAMEEQVREIRNRIEELWSLVSPLVKEGDRAKA